jgi:2',3'-cyclic-nucleotide 2'-phosphodiesterase
MGLRVLFIGEIVGKAGVFCVKQLLPGLRKRLRPDFVIANVDGATSGFGIGKNHSIYLKKLGIDCMTGGDQIYFKKDMVTHIGSAYYMLRPANFPPGAPGRGWRYFSAGDHKIAVLSFLGQSGFNRIHAGNPFTYLPELVNRIKQETSVIILDFHAVTTAEKYSMFYHADGLVSAVIGTGQRVLTADARLMSKGTAVICDCGRTGSNGGVGGLDPEPEIRQFLRQIPERSQEAWIDPELQGVVIDIDDNGTAVSIETVREKTAEGQDDASGGSNGDSGNGSQGYL